MLSDSFRVITRKQSDRSYTLKLTNGKHTLISARAWYNDLADLWLVDHPTDNPVFNDGFKSIDRLKEKWKGFALASVIPLKTTPPPVVKRSGPPKSPSTYKAEMTTNTLLRIAEYAQEKFRKEPSDYRDVNSSLGKKIRAAVNYYGYLRKKEQRESAARNPDRPIPF